MVTIKFLTSNQITTYFKDDITFIEAQKMQSLLNKSRAVPIQVEEKGGGYYLTKGFTFFHALLKLKTSKPFPCLINQKVYANEIERIVAILRNGIYEEKTGWRFKHFFIKELVNNHQLSVNVIAQKIGKKLEYVTNFLIEEGIPDDFKSRAIQTNATVWMNAIYLHPLIPPSHKELYYELAAAGEWSFLNYLLTTASYNESMYGLYAHPYLFSRIVH